MDRLEGILYVVAAVFQVAAILFTFYMMRSRASRRAWQLLCAAFTLMLIARIVFAASTGGPTSPDKRLFTAIVSVAVSVLLFSSLIQIRKIARAQQRDEMIYRAVGDSLNYGVWICDASGRNTYASPSFLNLVGLTQSQCSAFGWADALHPDDRDATIAAWRDCVANGTLWYREHRFKGVDGRYHPILACGVPIKDAAGKIINWAGIQLDIRRLKEVEDRERAARHEAERQSRTKDDFLATVSHELRTPLNAIVGWTKVLQDALDDRATLVEGIEVIDRNARAQVSLIEDLLDMSRIIAGKVRFDVQKIEPDVFIKSAIEAVSPAASAKRIQIHFTPCPDAGPVSGDPARLQQVVWNLLTNAVKFTPRGGRIDVRLHRTDSHLQISVADTGEGIDPQFLPFLFDRFRQSDSSTTRKHGGLGIGLALVKNLTELHGGTVQAHSPGLGQGATFTIFLPIQMTHNTSPQPASPQLSPTPKIIDGKTPQLQGLRILVIDDDPDARVLVRRLLIDKKAEVSLAASAGEALQLLGTKQTDVIVSDIGMPGEDGYEFIRKAREKGFETPAMALTAFARPEDRLRAINAGFQLHLAKPVNPAELIASVASLAADTQSKPRPQAAVPHQPA